jgi:hypothetical protein
MKPSAALVRTWHARIKMTGAAGRGKTTRVMLLGTEARAPGLLLMHTSNHNASHEPVSLVFLRACSKVMIHL